MISGIFADLFLTVRVTLSQLPVAWKSVTQQLRTSDRIRCQLRAGPTGSGSPAAAPSPAPLAAGRVLGNTHLQVLFLSPMWFI